jgi:inorganic triphosphatase YgiF
MPGREAGRQSSREQSDREIELKFLVDDSGFKASQQWPALGLNGKRPPAKRLRTVYFDTARGDLRSRRMVLRMRGARRGYVMTLKWSGGFAGGMFERGEIEVACPHDVPNLALFGPDAALMISQVVEGQDLAAVYATDIRRMVHRVKTGTSDIEVAFDSGVIVAGDVSEPVREIELELKAGDVADLYRLGIELAAQFPVRLGSLAKSDRGAMLAAGERPQAVRAVAALGGEVSTDDATVDQALGRAINGCLAQFVGNWPAFEAGDGVSAVHQMRVAMRRLRAMLGLFHRSFPCPEFASLREEAKQIASLMGEARNLDVFIALVRGGPQKAFGGEPGFEAILHECEERRAVAYAKVSDLLRAASTTKFVLSAQAFIARYGWRNALTAEALPRLVAPAQDFAAAHLARLHGRALKRGKHLLAMSPHDRHALRIELKKLRYAADLFAPLFEGRARVKAYLKNAAAVQEQLGLFNDLAVAIEMIGALQAGDTRAGGIVLGWCGRGSVADDKTLKTCWREFRKARVFWS